MGERSSNSSVSVSSPTLDDLLDSLLALRRPQKKFRDKGHKEPPSSADPAKENVSPSHQTSSTYEIPVSDWQERMNQPLDDTAYFLLQSNDPPFVPPSSSLPSNSEPPDNSNDKLDRASYIRAFEETISGESATSFESTGIEKKDYEDDDGARSRKPWMLDDDSQPLPEKAIGGGGINEDEDVTGRIAQEESNFGNPTEIYTAPTLINNPLAGLNEINSNPTTPARHRRVSFDLDPSDKEEKSSSRSKRDESVVGTIQCKNPKCGKSATGLEARRDFKTCHNCTNAYYCSRDCRRIHWEKHKKVCMQSRVGQLCRAIITHVKEDSFVVSQLSTVAKRGYLAKGRGCVKLFFSSPDRAERFLTGGLPELPEPCYIPHMDMLPEQLGVTTFSELSETCRTYNPETRFVLYATVCVVNEVPTSGAVKWEREMISRSAKIRLLVPRTIEDNQPHHHAPAIPAHHLNPHEDIAEGVMPNRSPTHVASFAAAAGDAQTNENETLILRSVPTPASLKFDSSDDKRRREISFTNIQKHLVGRGVDLRRTYPDIYSKLCNYVENDEPFLPVTIYPKNSQGNHFMCVIMPESLDMDDSLYSLYSDPLRKIETIDISDE